MAQYLLTNPTLFADPTRLTPWLERLEAAGIDFKGPFHLNQTHWPQQLKEEDQLLALGGDGTVSAVAAHCVTSGARLAVLPAGTANDFARSLGVTAVNAVEVLANGREQHIDVGRLDGRLFLNVAHIGLGAEVSLNLTTPEKRRWGPWSYLGQLLWRLRHRRGFKGKLVFDGTSLYARWLEIAIANGPCFGGGHRIEEADLSSGTLTLVALRERPLRQLLRALLPASLGFARRRKLLRVEQVREVHFFADNPPAISSDGEQYGRLPLHCWIEPGALRVLSPRVSANLIESSDRP